MKQHNTKNELLKYKFLEMLTHAKGRDPITVQAHANAIHAFEVRQAIEYKEYLSNDKINKKTGGGISKSYLQHYTAHVKAFFEWLCNQKGYNNIKYDEVQYFNLSRNDRNRAMATGYQDSYEICEILETIRKMPEGNELEMRNKAMISLCLLTTPRISALQSARVCSIKYFREYDAWAFMQNPNLVNTKFANNITAYFIGSCEDIYRNVLNWLDYLRQKGFTEKDPLFPKITPSFTKEGLPILIMEKSFIKSQTTIRDIFKTSFQKNNLPYRKPHSFRHSIVRKAQVTPNSPAIISALNQNMGHALDVGTIIASYGTRPEHERAGILKRFELE